MRPRKAVPELFSTFIQFERDYFKRWVPDAKLQRSMKSCMELLPNATASEVFWTLYWYKIWQSAAAQMAVLHLSAYLQEPCYWAVKRTMAKFVNRQNQCSDYFQTAIAKVPQVIRRYNPNKYPSLKLYASLAFSTILRDNLRQQQEADLCTDWTLLRKVSRKRFINGLQHLGLSAHAIAQYQLVWICFKELYAQQTRQGEATEPSQDLWIAVANLYNTERQKQLTPPGALVKPDEIKQWLSNCASALRAYLYPTVGSLNVTKPGHEGEVQDDLPNPHSDSLLADLIAQEEQQIRQAQQAQVNTVLMSALQKLDEQSQLILRLYYQLNLNQKQIADETGLSQATVSRRLTHAKKALLKALVQWSQDALNISLTPSLIKDRGIDLEAWLTLSYGGFDLTPDSNLEEETE
jgi:RNA polymerase sigma factor (sigma-70 family)